MLAILSPVCCLKTVINYSQTVLSIVYYYLLVYLAIPICTELRSLNFVTEKNSVGYAMLWVEIRIYKNISSVKASYLCLWRINNEEKLARQQWVYVYRLQLCCTLIILCYKAASLLQTPWMPCCCNGHWWLRRCHNLFLLVATDDHISYINIQSRQLAYDWLLKYHVTGKPRPNCPCCTKRNKDQSSL